jgi:hypothetical protein
VCKTTPDIIIDPLPAQCDLEDLAKLCQQIGKTCRIMYELSQPPPGLAAERAALRNGLFNEWWAGLRDLVEHLGASSARLCR